MDDSLLVVLTVFVAVSAIALCIQAGMLFGVWKVTKKLQRQTEELMPQARSVLSRAETTLEESRKQIADMSAKANEVVSRVNEIAAKASDMMDTGKAQLAKLDDVLTDGTARAKVQLERAELVVDDTMTRVHQTVSAVHNGVLKPVREIQGVTAALRTAVQHFLRGGRPSVDQATQDDEMFI
jgi:hypothetical protein